MRICLVIINCEYYSCNQNKDDQTYRNSSTNTNYAMTEYKWREAKVLNHYGSWWDDSWGLWWGTLTSSTLTKHLLKKSRKLRSGSSTPLNVTPTMY